MPADDPLVGFSTDAVRFEKLLGQGAMGSVYKGVQLGLDRPVAIKVIAPHLIEDADYLARFEREAQTIGKLVHPHVIACHDFGPSPGPNGGRIYLMVLEYVDGSSLGGLAKTKKLSVRQVLELIRQSAEGLHAAHRLGIVHRDIKPDNIMVTRDWQAKLADFGLARQLADDAQLTQAGAIMGSPAFMSPEACRGLEPTPASDIYSLGCTLFQVLAGRPVFGGTSALAVMQEHITAAVPKLAAARPDLASLQPIIDRCLAKEPADRYSDAHQLAKALAAALAANPRELPAGRLAAPLPTSEQPTVATTRRGSLEEPDATVATRASAPRRRRAMIATGASIGFALLLVAAWPRTPAASDHPSAAPTTSQPEAAAPVDPATTGAQAPTPPVAGPTPPKVAPNPADVAALDAAERLIASNQLASAQQALDALVVSGDLKARKRALLERVDQGWKAYRQTIVQNLDSQERQIARDPAAAAAALGALDVPDRFPYLVTRRADLLARARGQPSQPARTDAPATAPAADAGEKITTLAAEAIAGRRCERSDPAAPALEPLGGFAPRTSYRWQDRSALLIRLPESNGGRDGVAVLIDGGGVARSLLLSARALEGSDSAPHPLATVSVPATGWTMITGRLSDRARGRHELFLSTADGPDQPFYVAAAAFGQDCVPGWADLKVTPGTLLGDGGLAPLYDLARDLRRRRPQFPQYDQVRLGLPDSLFRDAADRRQRVVDAVDARLLPPPDHPENRGEHLSAARAILEYATVGSVKFLLDRALGDHDRGNFYIHLLATAKAPPDTLAETIGRQFKDAAERSPGLFPVVVLSAEGWDGEPRKGWQSFTRALRSQMAGLPIIDLAQVPITLARYGQPIDLVAKSGQDLVWQGLEAGLLELRERIDDAVAR